METFSGRTSNRTSERELERIPAIARAGASEFPVKLWDYSPFGFAVTTPLDHPAGNRVKPGDPVRLSFDLGQGWLETLCKVENAQQFRGNRRLGLSRIDSTTTPDFLDAPEALHIDPAAAILGEIPNPILYGEWCPSRLRAIHPGLRFVLTSDDSTLILMPGQEIRVDLALPSTSENTYRGRVHSLGRTQEGSLAFLLEPVKISSGLEAVLGEYLAFAAKANPEDLRSLGFPIRFMRDRLDFRFAESREDLEKVQALRRDGYLETGKSAQPASEGAQTSLVKGAHRILCAFHEEILVATATLAFPSQGAPLARAWGPSGSVGLPPGLPPMEDLMEVHGVSVHRDYRRGDLLKALIEHIARVFVLSGRKHILKSCDPEALRHYRRMGFHETAKQDGSDFRLVLMDREAITRGRGIFTPAWLSLFGNVVKDLLDKQLLEPGAWTRMSILARLRLKPWIPDSVQARSERIFGDLLMEKRKS